jgi:hypothetical protein
MNKANELRMKAEAVLKERTEKTVVNNELLKKSVDYFIEIFSGNANRGKTSCVTSNIVKMVDGRFFCQTDSGGDGFYFENIDLFLKELENEGFSVRLSDRNKGGYIKLYASWD